MKKFRMTENWCTYKNLEICITLFIMETKKPIGFYFIFIYSAVIIICQLEKKIFEEENRIRRDETFTV